MHFRIGFHPKAHGRNLDHTTSRLLLDEIANIHEHGSVKAHIPARPHWGPYRRMMRETVKKTRKEIRTTILKRLRVDIGGRVVVTR